MIYFLRMKTFPQLSSWGRNMACLSMKVNKYFSSILLYDFHVNGHTRL